MLQRSGIAVLVLIGLLWIAVLAAAEDTAKEPAAKAEAEQPKVSVTAKDTKLTEVLESLAKQSNQKIVVESTIKGILPSLSLTDTEFDKALAAVCKASKIEWRKIYIAADSKLIEQPDKFAATVRLLGGLSFPDLMVAGSSTGKTAVHVSESKSVSKTREAMASHLGMSPVYLITNDAAAAAKAIAKDADNKDSQSAAVDKYIDISKNQIEMFMQMTPEEREQAMLAGLNLMDQIDPSYMSSVMQTLMSTDRENLRRMMARQTEALFHMDQDQRRAMIKLNMEMIKEITPEQMKIIQEDTQAVLQEIQAGQ